MTSGGIGWLECEPLRQLPWLVHAFSTRMGGVSRPPCAGLNLGLTASDQREHVEQNRRRFAKQLDVVGFVAAYARQVHSSHSLLVSRGASAGVEYQPAGSDASIAPGAAPAADALMTASSNVLLSIRIADCLPVLLVDAERRAVAAVHAGWRGALDRIIEKSVGDMRGAFGSDPQLLIAALGPSIRACCFEVGGEVVDAFQGRFTDAERFFRPLPKRPDSALDRYTSLMMNAHPPGHAPEHVPAAQLDLIAVAQHQLASAGLKAQNVQVADYCTACRTDLFFSHRREGAATGRQAAVVGVRADEF